MNFKGKMKTIYNLSYKSSNLHNCRNTYCPVLFFRRAAAASCFGACLACGGAGCDRSDTAGASPSNGSGGLVTRAGLDDPAALEKADAGSPLLPLEEAED